MSMRSSRRKFLPAVDVLDLRAVPAVFTAPVTDYAAPTTAPTVPLMTTAPTTTTAPLTPPPLTTTTTPSHDATLCPPPPCYNTTSITPVPTGWTPSNTTGTSYYGPTYSPTYDPMVLQPPASSMTY